MNLARKNILALYSWNVKFPEIFAKFHFPWHITEFLDNSPTLKKINFPDISLICMNPAKDCDTRFAILGKLGVTCIFFSIFHKLLLSKQYFWSYNNLRIYDHKFHKLDGNPEDCTITVYVFMPWPDEGSSEEIAFHFDVTYIHAYVTFVTRVQQMFIFTFKSTVRLIMSVFLLEVVTSVPSILGSWNWVCYLSRPKLLTLCQSCLWVMPWGGDMGRNISDL